MNWFILAILGVFSMALANIVQRVLMKNSKTDPYSFTVLFILISTIITGLFSFYKGFNFNFPKENIINLFISASLYGFGAVLSFKASKYLEASQNVLFIPLGTITTILTSVFFLHENLNLLKIIGVVLVFIPIYLLSSSSKDVSIKKGSTYALLTALFYGLAVTNDAYILKSYDAISYTPVIFLFSAIVLILCNPKSVISVAKIAISNEFVKISLFSLFYSLQAITYYVALNSGAGAGQISAIFKSEVIITVLLATIFLKERKDLKLKAIGAILTTVGIFLLR